MQAFLDTSQSMLAAASLLAVGELPQALSLLEASGEGDLAWTIADALGMPCDSYIQSVANTLAAAGEMEAAISFILSHIDKFIAEEVVSKLLCRHCTSERSAAKWVNQFKLKTLNWWGQSAREEESIGRDDAAVLGYVLSWQFEKAVTMGLEMCKKCFRQVLLIHIPKASYC